MTATRNFDKQSTEEALELPLYKVSIESLFFGYFYPLVRTPQEKQLFLELFKILKESILLHSRANTFHTSLTLFILLHKYQYKNQSITSKEVGQSPHKNEGKC